MTWKEAITKVLQEEGRPLHYQEITNLIFERGYRARKDAGRTPDQTVCAQLCSNKKMYQQCGSGYYAINGADSQTVKIEPKADEMNIEEEELLDDKIIKSYGMYWNRYDVDWKSANLFGSQNVGAGHVNFKEQKGIYLLHDAREVIYVGQATKQPISKRLADHTRDRLSGRWNRFSWFGFYGVGEDGKLLIDDFKNTEFTIETLANAFEAVLIEGLEPRQNRKGGNDFGFEFMQVPDPKLEKAKLIQKLISDLQ